MKTTMIAALAAAQLTAAAAPAQAAGLPIEQAATRQPGFEERAELAQASSDAPAAERPSAREEEPRKKRKSTGDKVLTGVAVVLGVGALAVGGLLVAIFAN